MKKILAAFALIAVLTAPALTTTPDTSFCAGFGDGYCAGYKSVRGQYALCPITPICPIPPIGCSNSDYSCGFTIGAVQGAEDAR